MVYTLTNFEIRNFLKLSLIVASQPCVPLPSISATTAALLGCAMLSRSIINPVWNCTRVRDDSFMCPGLLSLTVQQLFSRAH